MGNSMRFIRHDDGRRVLEPVSKNQLKSNKIIIIVLMLFETLKLTLKFDIKIQNLGLNYR